MAERASQLGTGDEAFEAKVVGKPTAFETALREKVAQRKPPVRGKDIRVLKAGETPEDAAMQARIDTLKSELRMLKGQARNDRMSQVQSTEPDLYEAIQKKLQTGKAAINEKLGEVHEIGTQGAQATADIQAALADVTQETSAQLGDALNVNKKSA